MALEAYMDTIHRCFRCGYCKFPPNYMDLDACPAYARFRLESFSAGGRLWLLRACCHPRGLIPAATTPPLPPPFPSIPEGPFGASATDRRERPKVASPPFRPHPRKLRCTITPRSNVMAPYFRPPGNQGKANLRLPRPANIATRLDSQRPGDRSAGSRTPRASPPPPPCCSYPRPPVPPTARPSSTTSSAGCTPLSP